MAVNGYPVVEVEVWTVVLHPCFELACCHGRRYVTCGDRPIAEELKMSHRELGEVKS